MLQVDVLDYALLGAVLGALGDELQVLFGFLLEDITLEYEPAILLQLLIFYQWRTYHLKHIIRNRRQQLHKLPQQPLFIPPNQLRLLHT